MLKRSRRSRKTRPGKAETSLETSAPSRTTRCTVVETRESLRTHRFHFHVPTKMVTSPLQITKHPTTQDRRRSTQRQWGQKNTPRQPLRERDVSCKGRSSFKKVMIRRWRAEESTRGTEVGLMTQTCTRLEGEGHAHDWSVRTMGETGMLGAKTKRVPRERGDTHLKTRGN